MNRQPVQSDVDTVQRVRIWYALLLVLFGVFAIRVFYLQVIRYDYYKKAALSDQLRQYEVPAERGVITAQLGGQQVPIVMNQKLYTLYADPTIIKDSSGSAEKLQRVIGGSSDDLEKQLKTKETRYVILKKKLTQKQSDGVLKLRLAGIGTQEQQYRTYPQGSMAAQLLGFVNDEGNGKYGIEQALNKQLRGTPGQLKAVTDINGVPLAANSSNLSTQPLAGKDIGLTLDVGMQAGLEKIVKAAQDKYKTKHTAAVIMDVKTGAVKAMANYPTYDPANYQKVEDAKTFQNLTVSEPIEPGSITKLFTTAAGLDKGVFSANTSFYDPGSWSIDGATVSDVEEDHAMGSQNIFTTLDKSLNTGATWMLMQMGGGQINGQARSTLYDYFTNHYHLGSATGIEQGYEADGYVPKPSDSGSGINLTYANISFGQAYSATAIQMAAGVTSLVNGGTYYQPYLVDQYTNADGSVTKVQPKVVKNKVISKQASDGIISLMEQANDSHIRVGFNYLDFGDKYSVGGKTGTAEIANPLGGYYKDKFNGTYLGFVGGDTPEYAIVVYNIEPTVYKGYAGAGTGQPVYADIVGMLIHNFGVKPKN